MLTSIIPLMTSSSKFLTSMTTPRFCDLLTFFLLSWGNFSHHSLKEVRGMAAMLSHSTRYEYFGVVSGNFCANVKISARSSVGFLFQPPNAEFRILDSCFQPCLIVNECGLKPICLGR